MNSRIVLLTLTIGSILTCIACGGGSSMGSHNPPPTFTIGGTVSGLVGSGLALQNNLSNNLVIKGNGTFTFTSPIPNDGTYNVTVLIQPTNPTQTCTVKNGAGTATVNVTNVTVTCVTPTYTIGGTVSGLKGSGLVLQDNLGDNLPVSSDGSFTFATPVASGSAYSVTVLTQPSQPDQTCSVASGSGTATANVTSVIVTCSNKTYTIGGTVSGLVGSGLALQNNLSNNLVITGNGSFTFTNPIASGSPYSVTVLTQPTNPAQTCTVTNGSGMVSGNVSNVAVACVTNATLTLSASVTGLTTGTLVLQDDQGKQLSFTSSTTQTFSNFYASGATYLVTVATQPAGETCTLSTNSSGTITANTTVTATCASNATLTLSATVTGLTSGTLILADDQGQQLTFTSSTTQNFSNLYASGATYSVTIAQQPTGATCTLSGNSSGTITANTTVTATCVSFTLSATVTGLTSGTLILQDDQGQQVSFTGNTTQTFSNTYASGATYSVIVSQQPAGQTCTLSSNSSGTITANTTVTATCAANATYSLSVTTTGLTTGTLIVQDDQKKQLTFTGNATQTFSNTYQSGATYSVTIFQQPTGETCTLSGNSGGTITANTTVTATCTTSTATGEWAWVNGDNIVAVGGIYPANNPVEPGTRYGSSTWTDASGHFWLFGGFGYDINGPKASQTTTAGAESVLSDLWQFDGTKWSFKEGQSQNGQCFAYPTSTGQAGSISARSNAVSWIDLSGNFWIFGGYVAYNPTGSCLVADAFNDLWEYNGAQWIWQGGSSINATNGTYNGIGNVGTPGARYYSTGARDASGNFWMFGGSGYDKSSTTVGFLNDLWKFDGTNWTWISGSSTQNQKGVYSGTAVPGSRYGASSWIDSSGNFWLFGGDGLDSSNAVGDMNDLWEFNVSTSKWTFMGGSTTVAAASAVYGTQGVGNPANTPGGRVWSTTWTTPNGDVWLYGGVYSPRDDFFEDLWKYSGGEWTWEAPAMPSNGSVFVNDLGTYPSSSGGGFQPGINPGSRMQGAAWTDSAGNLWLFGGYGLGSIPSGGTNVHAGFDSLQDLWEFQP